MCNEHLKIKWYHILTEKVNISRSENQKGVSEIFGEMEIYLSNESS